MNTHRRNGRRCATLAAMMALILCGRAGAQCEDLQFDAGEGNEDHEFGAALDVQGDLAVIGAGGFGPPLAEGAAYVYRFNGAEWIQEVRFNLPDPTTFDRFGAAVALDGDRIVVGARGEDHTPGDRGDVFNSGAAVVFRWTGREWVEEQKLTPEDPFTGQEFGRSVDIEGDTIVVGASGDGGALHVYRLQEQTWELEAVLTVAPGTDIQLGMNVNLEGDTIVSAAPNDGPGAVYVFEFDGVNWLPTQKIHPPGETEEFGVRIAQSGDALAVVSITDDDDEEGVVDMYAFDGATWQHEQTITQPNGNPHDEFGSGLSLVGDALAVGASENDENFSDVGTAYLFRFNGVKWVFERRFFPSDDDGQLAFGIAVELDGETLFVACEEGPVEDRGTVYVYDLGPFVDCDGNGVQDVCELALGLAEDCNLDGVPDACNDCNGNGFDDGCDIFDGISNDCDDNGIPDECEADCNLNGLADGCDIANGTSEDCNGNGVPDECDVATIFIAQSGLLSPVLEFVVHTYIVESPPTALADVTLFFTASADLDCTCVWIEVELNGVSFGQLFDFEGVEDCPAIPNTDQIVLSAEAFNNIVAGGDAVLTMVAVSDEQSPNQCGQWDAYITASVSYEIEPAFDDVDGNGVPDVCEIILGDIDFDGDVDATDLLLLLGLWGPCDDCDDCPADLDDDCIVGGNDLIILLGNWGGP